VSNAAGWVSMSLSYRNRIRDELRALKGERCTMRVSSKCTGRFEEVHHTQLRSVVGDDLRYLEPCCRPCNLEIGDPTKHDPEPTPRTRWG